MEEKLMLPSRMFAVGEEPVGIKVTSYGPSSGISRVMNALVEEERDIIRKSTFGKFVSITEQPSFSGRFVRFLMSRQLHVNKKHEIWVLFAGKPVRFSLREFSIVTGLPCGKVPKKSKSRMINNLNATSYWPSLFGKLESVSVAGVVKMLKRKTVTDTNTRVKYACLALLASVLMTTSHQQKILKEHVEEIQDLTTFFAYPWRRLSFQMLISSIKDKNVISLSQNSIAIKGFVHALQLVLIEAVPALLEVVQGNSTSSSESDGEHDEDEPREKKIFLSPGHARDLHECEETLVKCIITTDGGTEIDEGAYSWSDEEEDEKVDHMVRLINDDHTFSSCMFEGGVSKADVVRLVKAAKEKNAKKNFKNRKSKDKKFGSFIDLGETNVRGEASRVSITEADVFHIADIVVGKLREDFREMEKKIDQTCSRLETDITLEVTQQIQNMKSSVIDAIIGLIGTSGSVSATKSHLPNNVTTRTNVSNSSHLTNQNNEQDSPNTLCTKDDINQKTTEAEEAGKVAEVAAGEIMCRKSKRLKVLHGSLLEDNHFDQRMVTQRKEARPVGSRDSNVAECTLKYEKVLTIIKDKSNLCIGGMTVSTKDVVDIAGRKKNLQPKVMLTNPICF